jgi:hypothetical protein
MFKQITLLTLITATVLLAYQLAFPILYYCDNIQNACTGLCGGDFNLYYCGVDPACQYFDKCGFTCFLQTYPVCPVMGSCCNY